MKNKRGRPHNDDANTLLAIAHKIKSKDGITVRSAIVQCLPECSDSNIRRLQRKWRQEGQHYLNKVAEERPRTVNLNHVEAAHGSLSAAQELSALIDRMNGPAQRIKAIQESMRPDLSSINSAKSLVAALRPSAMDFLIEQQKLLNIYSPLESSSIFQALRNIENMAKRF